MVEGEAHNRAQVLYYFAENLVPRCDGVHERLAALRVKRKMRHAKSTAAVARLFSYGAWADKFEGAVHKPPLQGVALAMNEPLGRWASSCPERRCSASCRSWLLARDGQHGDRDSF